MHNCPQIAFDIVSYNAKSFHRDFLGQVGLKGEAMNLVSPSEATSVDWTRGSVAAQGQQSLKWYKVKKKLGNSFNQ